MVNRKEQILIMLKNMDPMLRYTGYIAAKLGVPYQNVSTILNQLHLEGKVKKIKFCRINLSG